MTSGPAALALVILLALSSGCTGVGAVIGGTIDAGMRTIEYPVNEWVCLGAYKHANDAAHPWRQLEDDRGRDFGEELVGLAVSGGGSRAAYFLAAVLDEMRRVPAPGGTGTARTLLDEIDFISSVSGGSLSSAYYVARRPRTNDRAALDAFFAQYRADMRKNFEARSLGRAILGFRWVPMLLTYYDRAYLFAGCWDANFFHDMTFADLPPPGGPIPTLLINGSSYSTGNKFIFSRLPSERLNASSVFRWFNESRRNRGGAAPEYRPFLTSGLDTLDSDIGRMKLSLAVAASCSVPGMLGPVALKSRAAGERDAYEQIGDGGLYDNYGLESLIQLFATILEERPGIKARVIVIDGSGYFPARLEHEIYGPRDYVDRMTSIAWLRGSHYTEIVYRLLPHIQAQSPEIPGAFRVGERSSSPFRNTRGDILTMYHEMTAEQLRQDEEGLRDRLVGRTLGMALDEFNERVRGIGTRLKLDDEDAVILDLKARRAVTDILLGGGGGAAAPSANRGSGRAGSR